MLFKILHQLVDITPDPILQPGDRRTRGGKRLYQPSALPTVYSQSFYPRSIRDWNRLPAAITDIATLEAFKTAVRASSGPVDF